MRRIMSSKAVKEAYQSVLDNRLAFSHFVSYRYVVKPEDLDKFMEHEKRVLYSVIAEEIQNKLPLKAEPKTIGRGHGYYDEGTELRGECFVFTPEQLLQLLDHMESLTTRDSRPQTIWGD